MLLVENAISRNNNNHICNILLLLELLRQIPFLIFLIITILNDITDNAIIKSVIKRFYMLLFTWIFWNHIKEVFMQGITIYCLIIVNQSLVLHIYLKSKELRDNLKPYRIFVIKGSTFIGVPIWFFGIKNVQIFISEYFWKSKLKIKPIRSLCWKYF